MFMLLAALLIVLTAPSLLVSATSTQNVTVVLAFDHTDYSPGAIDAMEKEAQAQLAPLRVRLAWHLKENIVGHPESGQMVVLTMSGKCSMQDVPVVPDEMGLPLGMTYASDGEILPFGKIDCDHIRQSILRVLTAGGQTDALLGRALGRVVAHEMYHMLSHSKRHAARGVTQKSLSAIDLTAERLP